MNIINAILEEIDFIMLKLVFVFIVLVLVSTAGGGHLMEAVIFLQMGLYYWPKQLLVTFNAHVMYRPMLGQCY